MKILCYGDSNTYGYDAAATFGGRFAEEFRWPELLGRVLGCETINCGLNGRRVPRFQRTLETDLALLRRHAPCDLVLVMLGTNDLLSEAAPEDVAAHMRRALQAMAASLPESRFVLCAPPPAIGWDLDFTEPFAELTELYRGLAEELGVFFVDTSLWGIPLDEDGVHFSARGHRLFAMKLSQSLRMLLS